MHLAIGSFISNDDPGMAVRMAKKSNVQVQYSKTRTFQVHHNFFLLASPKEKTNKQRERMLAGTPQQLWPINYSIHFFAIAAHCEMSLLFLLSFTHSKFIFSQGGSE